MFIRSLAIAALIFLSPSALVAHSQVQAALELAVSEDNKTWTVALPSGVLRSSDAGKTWQWQCPVAFGSGGKLGLMRRIYRRGKGFVLREQTSLKASPDGCAWTDIYEEGVVEVAGGGGAIWVIRGGTGAKAAIQRSAGDGPLVDVTPTTGAPWRHIATGQGSADHALVAGGPADKAVLLRTSDAGKTWQTVPGPADHSAAPLGWHPKHDLMILRAGGNDGERLWTGVVAGTTWKKHFDLPAGDPLRGAVWMPDGATDVVLVSGHEARVLRSTDGGKTFKKLADAPHAPCLHVVNGELIACSDNLLDKAVLHRSTDAGLSWKPITCIGQVSGTATCGASQAVCAGLWKVALLDARAIVGTCQTKRIPKPDGGSSSGGATDTASSSGASSSGASSGASSTSGGSSGGISTQPPPADDDGCGASPTGPSKWPAAMAILLAVFALGWRRQRRS